MNFVFPVDIIPFIVAIALELISPLPAKRTQRLVEKGLGVVAKYRPTKRHKRLYFICSRFASSHFINNTITSKYYYIAILYRGA